MKLQKFKERNNKQKSIIIFTITCVLLITGVFLYKTFAIFETNIDQDIINGEIQDMGDLEFAFYKEEDGQDKIVKEAPEKSEGYSLDTSSSYCKDMSTGEQVSNVIWDNERWGPFIANVSKTKTKCYLHFKKIYKEDTLNGAIPDLGNGRLIPIIILSNEAPTDSPYQNGHSGKVEKADITTNWYSYKDKKWANAVILRDGLSDTYKPGDEIKESDIESYFVWIPRYKYKLKEDESTYTGYTSIEAKGNKSDVSAFYADIEGGNKGANNAFEIEFETKDKGNKQGSSKGDLITHPAFVSFDSNGFWVGKFETGYNQNNTNDNVTPTDSWNSSDSKKDEQASNKVIIKSNVYSWRGMKIANAFYTSYNYQRELESHMMKNTEWGAVAYLTQSTYGRCTEKEGQTTCEEVRNNNNTFPITGYSAKEVPTIGYNAYSEYESVAIGKDGTYVNNYYNSASVISSTTGNYYGVYDMSGGTWEVVMGVMQGSSTNSSPASGKNKDFNSGFKGLYSNCNENGAKNGEVCGEDKENTTGLDWPSAKYYDLYDYHTSGEQFQRGILGDATKEMGTFYTLTYTSSSNKRSVGSYNADLAFFVEDVGPWFFRGNGPSDGTDAGLFAFTSLNGLTTVGFAFRIVLSP